MCRACHEEDGRNVNNENGPQACLFLHAAGCGMLPQCNVAVPEKIRGQAAINEVKSCRGN
jgi:hypothetical protein